jgi:tetratricopeptide (TPR) repeat protein
MPSVAIADLTQAIKINPRFMLAYYQRGVVYEFESEIDLAIADYTKAIELLNNPHITLNSTAITQQDIQESLNRLIDLAE